MQTSEKGVYAAGDCCEAYEMQSNDTRLVGLWANASQQGCVAGENMAGYTAVPATNIMQNISHFLDVDFIGIGSIERCGPEDLHYEHQKGDKYIRACKRPDGRLQCVNLLGYAKQGGIIRNLFVKKWTQSGRLSDMQTYCQLLEAGIPESFIDFIGGSFNV